MVGHRAAELEQLFQKWEKVELILNPQYRRNMFSSVKAGSAEVRTEKFFLALGDMPFIDSSIYRRLLDYPDPEVVIPKYRGKKGHPLLLSQSVAGSILEFEETRTMRDVLAGFPTLTVPVETDHILRDIDNQEDYRNLVQENR
ncbi:Molybdenum cofactor cytidylyltransferase [subsurface metagenome]